MDHSMIWPAVYAAASGLACYAVFHAAAILVEHRQNRRRSAQLRRRLLR